MQYVCDLDRKILMKKVFLARGNWGMVQLGGLYGGCCEQNEFMCVWFGRWLN